MRVRQETGNWLEFNRIENVERVYKILRDYLGADVRTNGQGRLLVSLQQDFLTIPRREYP